MCKHISKLMRKNVFQKTKYVCQHCVALKLANVQPVHVFLIQIIHGNAYLAICWQTPPPPGPKFANVPPVKSGGLQPLHGT